MKKKPKLDDIDVIFDDKPLTVEEEEQISSYIRKDKAKRRKKNTASKKTGATGK